MFSGYALIYQYNYQRPTKYVIYTLIRPVHRIRVASVLLFLLFRIREFADD